MCEIDLHATVEKLDVKAGECLMVTFIDSRGIPDNIDMIRAVLKESLPDGVSFFFTDGKGIRLSVVKAD